MPSKSQKIFLLFMDFAKKKKTSSESLDTETEKKIAFYRHINCMFSFNKKKQTIPRCPGRNCKYHYTLIFQTQRSYKKT